MAHAWCNSCHRPRKGFKLNKSFISLLSAIVWPLWWSPPSLKSHLCRLSVGHSHEINTFQDIAQNMPFFHRLWRPRKRHLSFPERSVSKILYNPCPKTMRQNPGKKGLLLPEMSHDTSCSCPQVTSKSSLNRCFPSAVWHPLSIWTFQAASVEQFSKWMFPVSFLTLLDYSQEDGHRKVKCPINHDSWDQQHK